MIFAAPLPFLEALEARAVRQLLPTELRTLLLQSIPAELRERAMFSAGVTNAQFLQEAHDGIEALTSGTTDQATVRAALKQLLDRLGYKPAEGEEGSLTDLSSDRRLNLILDTNVQQAQGYGAWKQEQDPAVLDQWPAQELVRVIDSKEKRDWASRWAEAGGLFFGGRMIALKNDPIWQKLSRFGTPYPPFDFNSGMDVSDIDRDEATALGLISDDIQIAPQDRDFNSDLQATPEVNSAALKEALSESLSGVAQFVGGVLRLVGGSR